MKSKSTLSSFLTFAGSALLAVSSLQAATYYWDNNAAANGFGPAGGSWATGASLWNADTDGNPGPTGTITTANTNATTDAVNFGNTTNGLAAGTVTVSGTVNSGNMTFASGSGAILLSTGTITLSGTQTTTVDNASDTIESVLAGAATSFTKAGSGSLLLTGANSFTGSTIVNGGTLNLGGGGTTGSLASTVLTLGGGAFHHTRSDSATHSFATTNINSRSSSISVSTGNILNLGTVTRGTVGTVDFSSTGSGILAAELASNAGGIMSGFTFGDSWAAANGPGVAISGLPSYTLTSVAGTTGPSYAAANIDVDNSAGTLDATITANSLRFSEADTNTLALATGTNTISTSGILVGSAVGANLSTISGGTLTGAVSKDLNIIQKNSSGGLTISSAIANNTLTSISKSGAGLLTLAGTNTFTGGLAIHAGTVALGNAGALNSTAGSQNAVTFTGESTKLALNGNSVVVRSLDSIAGSRVVENANAAAATLTIGNSGNANSTFDGLIQNGTGGGALGLIKAGTGLLYLSNASNSFTGGISISGGTLQGNNLSLGGSANTITFTANGELRPIYASSPTFTQGIVINSGVTGHLNAVNQFYQHTVSGVVSGSGTLLIAGTDNGNGNVILSNTGNTHTGIVTIGSFISGARNGNLFTASIADSSAAIQLGSTTQTGKLTFSGTSAAQAFATRVFTLSGTTGGGTIINNGGTANIVTISQNLAVTANGAKTLTLGGTNTGANAFSGTIGNSGSGATSITKADAGSWTLSGSNGYSGTTTISGGTLATTAASQGFGTNLGGISIAGAGTLSLRNDSTASFTNGTSPYNIANSASGATINVDRVTGTGTNTLTVGDLTTTSTAAVWGLNFTGANGVSLSAGALNTPLSTAGSQVHTITNNIAGGGSLTLASVFNQASTVASPDLAFAGTGTTIIAGAITQTLADMELKKNGAGTLLLNGTNTYTGLTTVSAGTLGGTGTIAGAVTVAAAGNVAPGASIGTLTINNNLTVSAMAGGTGVMTYELGPIASSDKIAITGTLDIGTGVLGFNNFAFSNAGGLQNGTYKLITSGAAVTGTLDGANLTGTVGSGSGTLQITGNDLELVVSGIGAGDPYATWSGGAAFGADTNNDGVENGMAWVLGATDKDSNAIGLLPTFDNTTDPDFFIFTYRRDDDANTDPNTTIKAEYGSTLAGWTPAVAGVDIIITPTNDGAGVGIDSVQVKIRRTLAVGGKLFARLNAVKAP